MVRVISVHHFSKQDVAPCPAPTASVVVPGKDGDSEDTLVLATDAQAIEIISLSGNGAASGKLSHSFQTIDLVSELLYSGAGDFLLTLEGRPGHPDSASVRAYTNWADASVADGAPIRPRIAGRVTPTQDQARVVDMIEFPQRDSPVQIAICPTTGNVAVAAANLVILYKYVLKTHETQAKGAEYVDFQECFHIFHNFLPTELVLCEDVVGCLSPNELHIFKIKISAEDVAAATDMRSISLYSFTSDSDNSIEPLHHRRNSSSNSESGGDPSSPGDVGSGGGGNQKKKIKNVTMSLHQDSEVGEASGRLEGYVGNVRRHPNHVFLSGSASNATKVLLPEIEEANRDYLSMVSTPRIMEHTLGPQSPPLHRPTTVKYIAPTSSSQFRSSCGDFEAECVTLVYCKLLPTEERHETFQNLCLQPVYWREYRVRRSASASSCQQLRSPGVFATSPTGSQHPSQQLLNHPLQSAYHCHFMSLTACFTSQNEGYLYHLPGHVRKPGRGCGVRRIATYPFTSPVSKVSLEPTLMHALTETGLETYTLRSGYYTVLEAENVNGRTNACPGGESNPICLVGLRPFLGAKRLMVAGSHLVLLSQSTDDVTGDISEPRWTMYSLSLPTHTDLYRDMMQLANMNRQISPQSYFQLLCEAHLVLRTSYRHLAWNAARNLRPCASGASKVTDKILQETKEKFQETCFLLGCYYVISNDEWKLALPYFRMSARPIASVLKESKDCWAKSKQYQEHILPPGMLHYIREVVLKPTPMENTLDASLADQIIDLLGNLSLGVLASLVLSSSTFRSFKTSKMFEHFRRSLASEPRPDPAQVLAFVLLGVDKGASEETRSTLQTLATDAALSGLLIEHHSFLLDTTDADAVAFSEFALFVRDCLPQLFAEVLVSLIKGGVYQFDAILSLFLGSMVSMSSSSRNDSEATQNTAMLQLFLETYFTEQLLEAEVSGTDVVVHQEQQEQQEQALQTLVRSYLLSLSVPVRFGEKNIDADMFGHRHDYLDKLPPFGSSISGSGGGGSSSAKEVMLEADSPDFWCQNSLLKLQSLLCSSLASASAAKSSACKATVLHFLDMYPDVVGSFSLRVLSSDPSQAIPLLCASHPAALLPYAKEAGLQQAHWQQMLTCLQERLSSAEAAEDKQQSQMQPGTLLHEDWYTAMQEMLDHLAQTLSLDAFLQVLPSSSHSSEDFQGYIQMCRRNQQAADIQKLIVNTGNQLVSTLTL